MSITPTVIIPSASPRPYAGALASLLECNVVSTGSPQGSPSVGNWVCGDHMSTQHNPLTVDTFGSKRLDPGSFVGFLT